MKKFLLSLVLIVSAVSSPVIAGNISDPVSFITVFGTSGRLGLAVDRLGLVVGPEYTWSRGTAAVYMSLEVYHFAKLDHRVGAEIGPTFGSTDIRLGGNYGSWSHTSSAYISFDFRSLEPRTNIWGLPRCVKVGINNDRHIWIGVLDEITWKH